jgi:16S rRNA (adenine1518-N6/adenine1519-N6)-dimethyltransferase
LAEGDTPQLPPLREVIAAHGLAARRSFGQHFLLDLNLCRRIVRGAGPLQGSTVVEVGPGPGGLTRALLETEVRRVIAIERDERFMAPLAELAAAHPGRLAVLQRDALDVDVADLADDASPIRIVANLPYNVATPLLLSWLRRIDRLSGLVLMFQKEVAARLTAAPRTPAYGRLSIVAQWLCTVEGLFDVPARAFVPPPKVTSAVVRLTPLPSPLAPTAFADLETVTAAAFGHRRKMLRGALRSLVSDPEGLLAAAELPPTARAEELTVAQFCALARAFAARTATAPRADA